MVVVSGSLQIREWTDKDGNKRRSAEVVVRNMYFGDSKRNDDSANQNMGAFTQPNTGEFAPITDDDALLPF
jgi:single-strand DNA-binding protein